METGCRYPFGVGAKELVVSTLGVLYADDAEADAVSLGERIPITPLVAFGYMVFVLIYFPCIATLAAIKENRAVGNGLWLQRCTLLSLHGWCPLQFIR